MTASKELKSAVRGFYEIFSSADVDGVVAMWSKHKAALVIGTAPEEWISGYEAIAAMFKASMPEMRGMRLVADEVVAYAEENVGWSADRSHFALPDGSEVPFRSTTVWRKERGTWKLLHVHSSSGVPNEELVGKAIPVR
jgi:ketosteroid isomerase-like protein